MPEIFNPAGLLAPLNHLTNSFGIPLLLLLFYAPNPIHLVTQGIFLDSSFQWWIAVALFFVGLVAVTFNISGPFRYGKQQYGPELTQVIGKLPDWAMPSAVLSLSSYFHAWKYTREHHQEAIQNINDLVGAIQSRAKAAARAAGEDASSAARCEDRAHDIAARSWRDVRMGENLRVADYYDKSAQAWAAIDGMVRATTAATDSAKNSTDQVNRAQNRDGGYGIANLYTMVVDAYNMSLNAKSEAQKAQDRALGFKATAGLVEKSRKDEMSSATKATELMAKVAVSVTAASAAAGRARGAAEEALRFGDRAKTLALLGDIDLATNESRSAESAAKKAEDDSKAAESEKDKCRSFVRDMASKLI
ncbi:hypothetical protein BDZ45DRAFT_809727 [Acephala macrosclerotiorum]|nr:hypothetical protein BDZ45DRAFT_809727 [Acephala macrosclerotiorum]